MKTIAYDVIDVNSFYRTVNEIPPPKTGVKHPYYTTCKGVPDPAGSTSAFRSRENCGIRSKRDVIRWGRARWKRLLAKFIVLPAHPLFFWRSPQILRAQKTLVTRMILSLNLDPETSFPPPPLDSSLDKSFYTLKTSRFLNQWTHQPDTRISPFVSKPTVAQLEAVRYALRSLHHRNAPHRLFTQVPDGLLTLPKLMHFLLSLFCSAPVITPMKTSPQQLQTKIDTNTTFY